MAEVFNGDKMREVRARFRAGAMEPACGRCNMVVTENRLLHDGLSSLASWATP